MVLQAEDMDLVQGNEAKPIRTEVGWNGWRIFMRRKADKETEIDFTICPYCNGEMADGKCKECNWEPRFEYPPVDETLKGWPDTHGAD